MTTPRDRTTLNSHFVDLPHHRAKEEAAMLNSLACASRVQLAHRLRFNTLLQVIQQRAVSTDHFQTLGIEQSFEVSPTDLKNRYKSLMMELHPDRHADNNSDKDSKAAEATQVTHAYDVLANPLSRALHLLELNGSSIDEGDGSIIPPSILMQVMELREQIEHNTTDEELRPLLYECRTKQSELCNELTRAFQESDVTEAKYLTACLQYWSRIEERILDKITEV